ncbi:MAG: V-type proton ATPase subunit E [Bacilli bacterium]|nr:V-type proton ATPase subunit E [Bacilli bacterium]
MPNSEERNLLKARRDLLREQYKNLKRELIQAPYDSPEYHMILSDLGGVKYEITKLRKALFESSNLKQYLDELLGFVFLGERPYNGR